MSDPLAEAIAMLKLKAVLTKTVTGAGSWRIRRSDEGLSFYCAVLEGACCLELAGHDPLTLHAGDFVLIPAAYHFALTSLVPPASSDVNTTPVEIAERHFRLGDTHAAPEMLALVGHCMSESPDAGLLVSLLPECVFVRDEQRLSLLVGMLKEEAQAQRSGKAFVLARIIELLFIEAIRSATSLATPGLVRGLADPRIGQAIRLIHQDPARRWTVNALASSCALSRSTLFERFTALTGVTLLSWRMTLAIQQLCQNGVTVAQVAERIGYGSASAFSVAFTRYVGVPPGKYAQHRAAVTNSGQVRHAGVQVPCEREARVRN
ncbi:AraC family transcriptional regulator [Leclercia sp.]|uniref:AraC family transcriptional regulator n=1 Tax=Leclercia sp. TaxID=1898428 RepID=UPI002FDEE3F2